MKRIAVLVLGLLAFLVPVAAPAQADPNDAGVALPLLPSRVLCVHPTFTVTGSGWKVHQAVRLWNEAQSTVRLTLDREPGCDTFYVRLFDGLGDERCGYVSWDRTWGAGYVNADGVWSVSGGDIFLNARCGHARTTFVNKRTVAHELGHAMGLPHTTSNRSVMDAGDIEIVPWRALIAPVDVRDLAALYAG